MPTKTHFAITGGIGSGKSTVISELKNFLPNASFYSADGFVAVLYNDTQWCNWLDANFGTHKKEELSKIAFSDPIAKKMLEDESAEFIMTQFESALSEDGLVVIEVPQLFEFGLQTMFDKSILLTANKNVRIERAMARDNKTPSEILKIIDSQMQDSEKRLLADLIVETDSSTPRECACAIYLYIENTLCPQEL